MVGGMPELPHCAWIDMQWTFEVSPFQILNSSPTRPVCPSLNDFGTFRRAMRLLAPSVSEPLTNSAALNIKKNLALGWNSSWIMQSSFAVDQNGL